MATQWISPTWRMPENSNQSKFENYSLEFPGTGGYVTCTSAGDLFGNNEAFTFSFWCKVNTMAAYKAFFDFSPNAGFGLLALRTQSTSIIELLKSGASLGTYSFSDTTSFHNFCIVYDKTDIKLYIDNVEVISSAQTNMGDFTGLDLHIANGYFLTSLLDCNFSDVCLFKYAASSDQRSYLFNSGTPQNPMAISGQPPVAYYPLGGGSTGDAGTSPSTLTVPNQSVPGSTAFQPLGSGQLMDLGGSDLWSDILVGTNRTAIATLSYWTKGPFPAWARQWEMGAANHDLRRQGTNQRFYYRAGTANTYQYYNMKDTGGTDIPGVDLDSSNWLHVVLVFPAGSVIDSSGTAAGGGVGDVNLFINGVECEKTTTSTSYGYPTAWGSGGYGIQNVTNAQLTPHSNVQIWNSVLTSGEITTLYNNGTPYLGTQPQASNLKGWWRLNVDTSTWDGSDWIIGEAQANYSSALNFDGTNDKITLASTFSATDEFTLSLWIRPTTLSTNTNILGNGSAGTNWINPSATSTIRLRTTSALMNFVEGSNFLVLNAWNHILMYRDSNDDIGLYVNGNTFSSTQNNNATLTLQTFANGPLSKWFDGDISNVAFWTSDQSANVATLYNGGTPEASISFSPTGWWKLDNLTTGIQDSAGSNNGTNNGATVTDIQVSTLNGKSSGMTTANLVTSDLSRSIPYSSYSMVFDGLDDFITIPDSSSLNFSGDTTLSAWVYPTASSSTYDMVITKNSTDNTSVQYQFYLQYNGITSKRLRFASTGSTTTSSSGILYNDTWNHVALSINSGVTNGSVFYINGQSAGTATFSITANTEDVFIGDRSSNQYEFEGNINNVSVFNKALSENDILTIYNGGVPNDISSLSPVGWWSLSGDSYYNGSNWICPDLSGNNNNSLTSNGLDTTDLVGNGPGSTANGLGTSMNIPENLKGNAPNSTSNAFSINMNPENRVEDVAPTP